MRFEGGCCSGARRERERSCRLPILLVWFRVQGLDFSLAFRVRRVGLRRTAAVHFGFGVWGLGVGVQGLGFRVYLGCRV
jgi:hypothetical protein